MKHCFVVCLVLFAAISVNAQRVEPAWGRSPARPRQFAAPTQMARAIASKPEHRLPKMSDDDLGALRLKASSSVGPSHVGIVRTLPEPLLVRPSVSTLSTEWSWSAGFHVPTATRLRLRLEVNRLPEDVVFWVYDANGLAVAFDGSLVHNGVLWTPSVEGEKIWLESQSQHAAAVSFAITAVADIRSPSELVPTDTSCLRDVACESTSIANAGSAIGLYSFITGPSVAACSGGLILDMDGTFAPYFLTANHCVSTTSEASTVEVFWDYRATTCNAQAPPLSSRPRTSGSTLLTTSATSDMTLLRLSSVPGTRYWLGWTTDAVPHGTRVSRVSNPDSGPQRYSLTSIDANSQTCSALPRPRYLYGTRITGDTMGGSSGAPAWIDDGVIVGQLFGKCGPRPEETCDPANRAADGALSYSYSLLQPFINPGTANQCQPCVASKEVACLLGGRFKVTLNWTNRFANPVATGTGKIIKYVENVMTSDPQHGPMSEIAYFSMFDFSPTAVESIVRIINGVGINDKYWVYVTGFANIEYTVSITDTRTCRTWSRTNPNGTFPMIADQQAFPLN